MARTPKEDAKNEDLAPGVPEDAALHPAEDLMGDTPAGNHTDTPPGTAGNDPEAQEKISVKTTGEFMISDPYSGAVVKPGEAQEVPKTSFILNHVEMGNLEEA